MARAMAAGGAGSERSTAARAPAAPDITSVLIVTPRWTRDGGVATHVIASAAALARNGVAVRVLAARVEDQEPLPGVEVVHGPQLFDHAATPAARFGEALGADPGAIHLHQFDDPTAVAEMRRTAPVVVSAHGYPACTSGLHYFRPGHECGRPHGPGCVPNLLGCAHTSDPRRLPASYRHAGRSLATLQRADLAISYSTAVDRHLAANGIERREIVPLFSTMEPHEDPGGQRRRVVFAGRIVLPKGIRVLIRAMREVDGELIVCGDGWRLGQMRSLSARLGIEQRVAFRGWLGPAELARELAGASVVAVPSVWPEPFGLVGLEAFAAGRPVVASNTGGIPDWLEHGVNGLLVEPGDERGLARALAELLDDPARQRALGAAGRERTAGSFSSQRHVESLLGAYRRARTNWEAAF